MILKTVVFFSFISFLLLFSVQAQDGYRRNKDADVTHYVFDLSLNDEDQMIIGEAEIQVAFRRVTDTFALDLVGKTGDFGMELLEVL